MVKIAFEQQHCTRRYSVPMLSAAALSALEQQKSDPTENHCCYGNGAIKEQREEQRGDSAKQRTISDPCDEKKREFTKQSKLPLKKRPLREMMNDSSENEEDSDGSLPPPPTKLRRLVASCWNDDRLVRSMIQLQISSPNWKEITKKSPSSGSYVYEEQYAAEYLASRSRHGGAPPTSPTTICAPHESMTKKKHMKDTPHDSLKEASSRERVVALNLGELSKKEAGYAAGPTPNAPATPIFTQNAPPATTNVSRSGLEPHIHGKCSNFEERSKTDENKAAGNFGDRSEREVGSKSNFSATPIATKAAPSASINDTSDLKPPALSMDSNFGGWLKMCAANAVPNASPSTGAAQILSAMKTTIANDAHFTAVHRSANPHRLGNDSMSYSTDDTEQASLLESSQKVVLKQPPKQDPEDDEEELLAMEALVNANATAIASCPANASNCVQSVTPSPDPCQQGKPETNMTGHLLSPTKSASGIANAERTKYSDESPPPLHIRPTPLKRSTAGIIAAVQETTAVKGIRKINHDAVHRHETFTFMSKSTLSSTDVQERKHDFRRISRDRHAFHRNAGPNREQARIRELQEIIPGFVEVPVGELEHLRYPTPLFTSPVRPSRLASASATDKHCHVSVHAVQEAPSPVQPPSLARYVYKPTGPVIPENPNETIPLPTEYNLHFQDAPRPKVTPHEAATTSATASTPARSIAVEYPTTPYEPGPSTFQLNHPLFTPVQLTRVASAFAPGRETSSTTTPRHAHFQSSEL